MNKHVMRAVLAALTVCFALLLHSAALAADVQPLSEQERREYALLSPFEFKNELGDAAKDTAKASGKPVYNAGRGNPNFINSRVRYAFSMLHRFAVDQARPAEVGPDLAYPLRQAPGMAAAFKTFLGAQADQDSADFLARSVDHA